MEGLLPGEEVVLLARGDDVYEVVGDALALELVLG